MRALNIKGSVMKESNRGFARESLVAAFGGAGATGLTSLAAWLSPGAKAWLIGIWQLHVWQACGLVGLALLLGGIIGLWVGHQRGTTSPASSSPSAKPLSPSPEFKPSELHRLCIKALRFRDNEYLTVGEIASMLERAGTRTPKGDIEQSLTDLVDQSWVSDRLDGYHTGWEYKLSGPGVTYARQEKFLTAGDV